MMPDTPSLLMVVTEDWYFLSHRLALAREAARRGLRVIIATAPGDRGAEIQAAGLEHVVLPLRRRGMHPLRESRTILALLQTMRRLRPSVVHLVAAKPILYGNVAALFAGRPPVLNAVAGLGYLYLGQGLSPAVMRRVYEGAFRFLIRPSSKQRVLVQNDDDADLLVRRGMVGRGQLIQILGSGVDTQRFRPTPEPSGGPLVILMHSRMLKDKGVVELVEAARRLRQRGAPEFVVRLVGEPDPANPASIPPEQLQAWSDSGVVQWAGRRDDIPRELAACHIACLPSYREGAPLSLLEAAAAGRPIVTTDVPGCRAVVHDGENGLLVPAREVEGLVAALDRLLRDPALRAELGQNGRLRAEREFAAEVVNSRIVDAYGEMMRGAVRP